MVISLSRVGAAQVCLHRIRIGLAAVVLAGCGARTELRDGGSGFAAGSGGDGGGGSSSSAAGGGGPSCPVTAFEGDQSGGIRLEMDATHAYWTTLEGRLERGSLETGDVETLVELSGATTAIALDGEWVYAADDFQLRRVPKAGGAFESLAPGAFIPMDLVADGESVFLLDRGAGILAGSLQRWTPAGGLVTVLDNIGFPRAMTGDDESLFVVAESALVDGQLLEGPLLRVTKDGASVELLAAGLREPFGVEDDGERVVWGTSISEAFEIDVRLYASPKTGGAPVQLSALGTDGLAVALALDDAFAYATIAVFDQPDGPTVSRLVRAPLYGGDPEVILELTGRFSTEPAATSTHLAVSVQHDLMDDERRGFANVLVRCKR